MCEKQTIIPVIGEPLKDFSETRNIIPENEEVTEFIVYTRSETDKYLRRYQFGRQYGEFILESIEIVDKED